MSTKAVTKKKSTEVAEYDFSEYQDIGADLGAEDMATPFYDIIQANSKAIQDEVEGAKPGLIINKTTDEFNKEIHVLFAHRERKFVEWVPRGSGEGGGLVGVHDPDSPAVLKAKSGAGRQIGKLSIGENELVETIYVYVVRYDPETFEPLESGVIPFSSTKIKVFKKWITSLRTARRGVPPVLFGTKIGTVKQKNNKGTFYNYEILPATGENWRDAMLNPNDPAQKELLDTAKQLANTVNNSDLEAAIRKAGVEDSASSDDDVPF